MVFLTGTNPKVDREQDVGTIFMKKPVAEQSVPQQKRVRDQRLISITVPCKPLDPLSVLGQAKGQERWYWEDGRAGTTIIGLGVAANLQAWGPDRFQQIAEQIENLFDSALIDSEIPVVAEPHCFGGFAFSDQFAPDNTWSVYHPAHFILPHYQYGLYTSDQEKQAAWLTINALVDSDDHQAKDELEAVSNQLRSALLTRLDQIAGAAPDDSTSHPPLASVQYPMSYQTWQQMLEKAIENCLTGRLKKVVLSRVAEIRFQETVNVDKALRYLQQQYPQCYRFLFEPRLHHAFFGASPEELVTLRGSQIYTMALAGSEPRGATAAEDLRLGQRLLDSAKDRHEHQLVVEAIRKRLEPISSHLSIPREPQLLQLSNIQHLHTPIEALLSQSKSIFDLLKLLHPTPALGGSPQKEALGFIDAEEPVPRGWYAAPIGLVNRHMEGTFSVAIRSAVTAYERVWLHAGAGIVGASVPQKEWDETALKFQPILNALGIP